MGIFGNSSKKHKTPEQRKEQNEKILLSNNIPFIKHLPIIENETEANIRTPHEIAERILILTYLNYVSEVQDDRFKVIEFLKSNNLWNKVSPNEKGLFKADKLSEQELIDISWRSEAIWLLLWTIYKVDKLELPIEQAEISDIVDKLPNFMSNPTEFIETAEIRPTNEILDISDLTYRLHWAIKHDELNTPKTLRLNSSIVIERHYAINWVTYYGDEWDNITLDT